MQLVILAYSYYVYTFELCLRMLLSSAQRCVYLCVYNWIFFFVFWSLIQTLRTAPVQIPSVYYLDAETDKQLKEVTHSEEGRYHADRSSSQQIQQQKEILDSVAAKRGLLFVETDRYNRIRYCYLCMVMKPDRCHHCSSCGICVPKYDHHCPWINKCVSYSNYKFYMLYLGYGFTLIAWTVLTSIQGVVLFFMDVSHNGASFGQIVLCTTIQLTAAYFLVWHLLKYHLELIALNETTCEQSKIPVFRGDSKKGYTWSKLDNFRSVFGWGLWAFPVDTRIGDGLHFNVHYDEEYEGERIVLRTSESEVSNVPSSGH